VNDAPSSTNLSAAETYTEDTALNLTDMYPSVTLILKIPMFFVLT
jgi:hypothetical protein